MPEFNIPRAAEYLDLLEDRLPSKTFKHVVSVARHMASFAARAGITEEQAVTAGLLHDLCKPMKGTELTAKANEYGIPLIALYREYPGLLHGPVGAGEAKRLFAIEDDVYDAIYWHTTGRPKWSRVGCALYLGDFSEPLRTIPAAKEAREVLANEGFGAALRYAVEAKLSYVAKQASVDPLSHQFQQWVEKEFA